MCFELDARPPLPPIRGGASDARGLLLTSGDGTRFSAYAARATQPAAPGSAAPGSAAPGIVVIPDIRGLHPYYEELALRFAEAGVNAVAIDLYARTAGTGSRDEDFDAQSHAAQARPDAASADVAAAVGYLRGREGGGAERVYTVGFCFGGRISFLQAAERHGLAGVIGFYGPPVGGNRGMPAPADLADRFECPVLGLFGGADQAIGSEAREQFEQALRAAGVEHRLVVYPGAPHSFFDRRAAEFADASAAAWREVLRFIGVAGARSPQG